MTKKELITLLTLAQGAVDWLDYSEHPGVAATRRTFVLALEDAARIPGSPDGQLISLGE